MQRPSSLPPGWQPPSGFSSRRRRSPEAPPRDERRSSRNRDHRSSRWLVPAVRERESDAWQISYLDLLSLLLVVFAVLLAVTKMDLNAALAQVAAMTTPEPEPALTSSQNDADSGNLPVILVSPLRAEGLNPIPEPNLQAYASPTLPPEPTPAILPTPTPVQWHLDELGDDIAAIVDDKAIRFRISSESLFAAGQADLLPSGGAVLARLAKVLAEHDSQISIEGHSDATPIKSDRFPSNWELSTGRAASVLRHLESLGIRSGRLRATGYADTRPISSNDTAVGRAANRRVELVMEVPRVLGSLGAS